MHSDYAGAIDALDNAADIMDQAAEAAEGGDYKLMGHYISVAADEASTAVEKLQ